MPMAWKGAIRFGQGNIPAIPLNFMYFLEERENLKLLKLSAGGNRRVLDMSGPLAGRNTARRR